MCGAICEDLLCLQHTDSPCAGQQTLELVGAASETPYSVCSILVTLITLQLTDHVVSH